MRVLFLGAGASANAGYPLAPNLLDELESELGSGHVGAPHLWEEFVNLRRHETGVLSDLLSSKNPEVVLSALDLLLAERRSREENWLRQLSRLDWKGEAPVSADPHPYETEGSTFKQANLAREGLRRGLDAFFSWKHCQDRLDGSKRGYLRTELSKLERGDVVITTNWDTLAERTLLELASWSPRDGYGFSADLQVKRSALAGSRRSAEIPRALVKVLKLHGSVGWHVGKGKGGFYLRGAGFLQHLRLKVGEREMVVEDRRERERRYLAHGAPIAIYPSFLKSLDIPQIRQVWAMADHALRKAKAVTIIGYSLPESDSAIRRSACS